MSVSSHIFKKLISSLDTTKYYLKYKISSQIEKAVVLNTIPIKSNIVTVTICNENIR